MSDFTQEQLTALNAAIAEGVTKVKYQDKEVEYRSLKEMIQLRNLMKAELNPAGTNTGNGQRNVGVFISGN